MYIKNLMDSQYTQLVNSFCTISALIFAIYTWLVVPRRKEIACVWNSYQLIEAGNRRIPLLTLTYQDKKIDNLAVSRFAIWNSGKEVIEKSDLVESHQLKISTKDRAKILDCSLIYVNDEDNKFNIKNICEESAEICFDYLDTRDGAVIQVIHTGNRDELCIDCKIKGGKKLNIRNNLKNNKHNIFESKYSQLLLFITEIGLATKISVDSFMLEWGVISPEDLNYWYPFKNAYVTKGLSLILMILSIVVIALAIRFVKKYCFLNVPVDLRNNLAQDNFDR